jgi:glucose-6-phosphate isomerase
MVQLLEQYLDACLSGRAGISQAMFDTLVERGRPAIRLLREALARGELSCFGMAARRDDLIPLGEIAAQVKAGGRQIIVLVSQELALRAHVLTALLPAAATERPVLLVAGDQEALVSVLQTQDPRRLQLVVVSDDADCTETAAALAIMLDWFGQSIRSEIAKSHVTCLLSSEDEATRAVAGSRDLVVVDMPVGTGGPMDILGAGAGVIGLIAGIDVQAIRTGASMTFENCLSEEDLSAVAGAACAVGMAVERRRPIQAVTAGWSGFSPLVAWLQEMWISSASDAGQGLTAMTFEGAGLSRAALKRLSSGAPDCFLTAISVRHLPVGPAVGTMPEPIAFMSNRALPALAQTRLRAAIEMLVSEGLPVRLLRIPAVEERAVGALLMHLMLEAWFAAYLLGHDADRAYDVRPMNHLVRTYLSAGKSPA